MNQNTCHVCGANYEYRDGRWVCPSCGSYKSTDASTLSSEEAKIVQEKKTTKILFIITAIIIFVMLITMLIVRSSPSSQFEYMKYWNNDYVTIKGIKNEGYAINNGTVKIPSTIDGMPVGLGSRVFEGNSFTTLILPKNLQEIFSDSLDGCNGLKNIVYKGTISDWKNLDGSEDIDISKYNFTHEGSCECTEWSINSNYDCEVGGTKTRNCLYCDKVYSETIAPTSHTAKSISKIEPTCTSNGKTEGTICSVCDKVVSEQKDIPKLSHTIVIDSAIQPTCTKTGLTEGSHCSVCNSTLTAQTTVSSLGHAYGGWTVSESPTCTKEGTNVRVCSTCDYKDYSKISANGHSYGAWSTTKAPSCTVEGTKSQTCSICKNVNSQAIPANGHSYFSGVCSACSKLKPSEGLIYTSNGNGYLVSGIGSCADTILVIPDTYNGLPIIGIAEDAFEGNLEITELVLGENIESIGESAFHNCENLSKIIVNEKLQTVDDFAFLNTDMGKIFDVPSASVWAAISFSSHAHPIGYVIYINGIHSYELTISGEKEVIRKYAFEDYYKVNSVIIENGIKTIEFYAFKGCDYLTEVTIPKSVTSIDKNAFYDSWRLETIYYEGTIAEWKALCKKTSLYISDVTVICSDGTTEAKYW